MLMCMGCCVAAAVREAIALHSVRAYPREGCGVLGGRVLADGTVAIERAIPVTNLASASAADRYELEPLEYARVERDLRKDGLSVVGFFHSHPNGAAIPSEIDLEAARGLYEFARERYVYAIQAVRAAKVLELRFWKLAADGVSFDELTA